MLASRLLRSSLACLVLSVFPCLAIGAPNLTGISLRGLRTGHATRVVLTGAELAANPKLLLDGKPVQQTIVSSAPNRVEVEVKLAQQAPGLRLLRLATDTGLSNAFVVGVDDLPQQAFSEDVPSLPVALTGSLAGGQILKTSFAGKKGQRIVAEIESLRLGSKARLVLRILDSRGAQLGYSARRVDLGGDARSEVVLPADGRYTVQLHDVIYKGPNPGHFRLKIGEFKTVDFALPLAVAAGTKTQISFLNSDQHVMVDATAATAGETLAVPAAAGLHSSASVGVSPGKEIVEQREGDQPQAIPSAPVGVTGLLDASSQEDRYVLEVKPGERLRFEVFARRIGSALDGVLTIRGEKGNQLARNDDQPSTSDPLVDYTVPKNVDRLVLGVSDIRGRADRNFIYRVAVRSLSQPDFALKVQEDRLNIPSGGVRVLRVEAARTAFNGPIALELPNLPSGVETAGDRIEAGANFTLITVTSPPDRPFAGQFRVIGRAEGVTPALTRAAQLKTPPPYAVAQPWLANTVALAQAAADPIRIRWADEPSPLNTHLGGEHKIALKLERNPQAQGEVRLKLLTTQVIPKKKVKQNNKEVVIDDLDRALRLPAEARTGAADVEYATQLMVPADLPDLAFHVIVQAELLSPKTKKPIATAYTAARLLRRQQPISLTGEANARVEARAGLGETGSLTGKIVRVDGFAKPITVTLEGLPKGYKAPVVVVPPNASEFTLPIRFDAKAKLAELKNVKLVGRYVPNPKAPALAVKTNALPVTINVVAGTPAKDAPPKKTPKAEAKK